MIAVERSTNISHVLRDNRRAISRAQAAPARSANTEARGDEADSSTERDDSDAESAHDGELESDGSRDDGEHASAPPTFTARL